MRKRQLKRRLIKLTEVQEIIPYSKPSIYRKMKDGSFPKSVKIGARAVAWWEDEIYSHAEKSEKSS